VFAKRGLLATIGKNASVRVAFSSELQRHNGYIKAFQYLASNIDVPIALKTRPPIYKLTVSVRQFKNNPVCCEGV
jgi:hypothetical protein